MSTVVTSAEVRLDDGSVAARVDLVGVGGGTQTVMVDGTPEDRVHDRKDVYHVRCVSPDGSVPDQLVEAGSYDEAVKLAESYATKRKSHAKDVAKLAASLKVGDTSTEEPAPE